MSGGRGEKSAARSLGVPVALGAYVPELFRGVRTFGSDRRLVVSMLKRHGVGAGHLLADVGCGKGALALSAARTLGCRVDGIDVFDPFIEQARRSAEIWGVAHLAAFQVARLEDWRPRKRFDAVAMIGLHPLMEAAAVCRRLLVPGGLLIVDDLVPTAGLARELDRLDRRLRRAGYLAQEVRLPLPDAVRDSMARLHRRLRANAARLRKRRPELKGEVADFLEYLKAAARSIPSRSRPAYWALRVLTT